MVAAVSVITNTPALHALLAIELYLMSQMSFRGALIVHDTLTRILYRCGFYRCPFQYIQLSSEVRDQDILVYICLDRQLSQVLSHPLVIRDVGEMSACLAWASSIKP